MVEFFLGLDVTVQVAVVTACGGVLVAIIKGLFSLNDNRKKKSQKAHKSRTDKVTISQTSTGHHNTFIGIQNIRKDDK